MSWKNRSGDKIISRDFLATGDLAGVRGGFKAHTVASLVGFSQKEQIGSQCILQGMDKGYIAKDARVIGIERDKSAWDGIEKHAAKSNINMTLHKGEFEDFVPPYKIDMFILDLMGTAHDWIGQKLIDDIVPNMSSRRAGIGMNLNLQRAKSSSSYKDNVKIFHEDTDYWNGIWAKNFQQGSVDYRNPKNTGPFSGVCDYELAMPTFVSIHKYMKDSGMTYRGCFRYKDSATQHKTGKGTQYMLSLRYEKK